MNAKYSHILYATDLTSNQKNLQAKVNHLCKLDNPALTIAHIFKDVPSFIDKTGYYNVDELRDNLHVDAGDQLIEIGKALNVTDNNNLKFAHGSVAQRIVDMADDLGCDLIVVGAHSKTGFAKYLGSNAKTIVEQAHCDVLVVK